MKSKNRWAAKAVVAAYIAAGIMAVFAAIVSCATAKGREQSDNDSPGYDWPGISVAPLTDDIRTELRIARSVEGVLVTDVVPGSPADIVGLASGDVITAINDEPVRDVLSFRMVLRKKTARELWFEIHRGTSTLETLRFRR